MRRTLVPLLCELHAHTRWSDGELTVRELVDLHGRGGFDVLCITDHVVRTDDPWREEEGCGNDTGRDSARYWGETICFTDGTVAASASGSTTPQVQLLVQGSQAINMPDNIAYQPGRGNWIVHEDGSTGAQPTGVGPNNDLWDCLDDGADIDTLSDGWVRIASINDTTAEWTGGFFDASGKNFYVSIQHNISGYGTILKITGWGSQA